MRSVEVSASIKIKLRLLAKNPCKFQEIFRWESDISEQAFQEIQESLLSSLSF